MYSLADRHAGYYMPGDGGPLPKEEPDVKASFTADHTIYYHENGADLCFSVVFLNDTAAHNFDYEIRTSWEEKPFNPLYATTQQQSALELSKEERNGLVAIRKDHYTRRTDLSDRAASPSSISTYSTMEFTEPLFIFQSLENKKSYRGLTLPEKAHIVPNADIIHGEFWGEDDPQNNRLALSTDLHKLFDGRHTEMGGPGFVITFLQATGETTQHSGGNRHGVRIQLTFFLTINDTYCRDDFVWREGTVKIGADKLEMTLFVLDVTKFKTYLDYKEKLTNHRRDPDAPHPREEYQAKKRTRSSNQQQ